MLHEQKDVQLSPGPEINMMNKGNPLRVIVEGIRLTDYIVCSRTRVLYVDNFPVKPPE